MAQNERPGLNVLQKVEDAFIGISDFVINFLRTIAILVQNPKELIRLIEENRLTPPYTFLFICCCSISIISTYFFSEIMEIPSRTILRFQQLSIKDLTFSILPTIILVLLVGIFIAKYLVPKDSGKSLTVRYVIYYSISFGYLSLSVFSVLFDILNNLYLRLPYQFRENTNIYIFVFLILILIYFVFFHPIRMVVNGLRQLWAPDDKKRWKSLWTIFLMTFTLFVGAYLSSNPILSTSERFYFTSTQIDPFKSIQNVDDDFIEITLILFHYQASSVVLSDELKIVGEDPNVKDIQIIYVCPFKVQIPPTMGSGLFSVKPKDPTIIQAIGSKDNINCSNLLGKKDFWVRVHGWEIGRYFVSDWTKVQSQ